MATRRNRQHIEAGQTLLETGALEDADLGKRRFDKISPSMSRRSAAWLAPTEPDTHQPFGNKCLSFDLKALLKLSSVSHQSEKRSHWRFLFG